jgi:hypothetical protein
MKELMSRRGFMLGVGAGVAATSWSHAFGGHEEKKS